KAERLLGPIFDERISKTTTNLLEAQIESISRSTVIVTLPTIVPLSEVLTESLTDAVEQAKSTNSTKPVTAWRNHWFKKDENGGFVLKSRDRQAKLRAISSIYEQYLARMEEAELYDFDDMILRVVHGMEVFDELRFNLQEKYQYIMVDEFQDTNMAQMRIVHNLTNNIAQGDTPNILVVGDDDQAIYSFQGADISNIINFRTNYPKARMIALTDNYRSGEVILDSSRDIIVQGADRLENHIDELDKNLTALTEAGPGNTKLLEAETSADERHWVVENIKESVAKGKKLSDIAVLTRKHKEIESLLPYFSRANISVQYERRDNVLDQAPIILIEQLARVLIGLYLGQYKEVNAQLPQVLSHPAWGIEPMSLWKLSLSAYESRLHWLDVMATIPEFIPLQKWIVTTALSIPHLPLESILDILIGKTDAQIGDTKHDNDTKSVELDEKEFTSPIYGYFFSTENLSDHSEDYVRYLESLRTIRTKLRDYNPTETPNLETFIEFINLHRSIGSGITSTRSASQKDNAIQLMTVHKSKGLEFDTVYIVNAVDNVWGERARSRNRLIGYPENLPLAPVGDTSDERLRLFYVAATRAKNELFITYSVADDSNKTTARASFLVNTNLQPSAISSDHNTTQALDTAEIRWYESLTQPNHQTIKELLAPQLEQYQLSVTHLTNFLDVTRDGPQNFLLQNLLRFPQAMSPAAAYGAAIHNTLQRAHSHLSAHGQRQAVEDIMHNFEMALEEQHLSRINFDTYLQKGSDDLQAFLAERYDTFSPSQKTELNFKSQHSIVGEAHLSGALDLVDIASDKTVTVTDYKTGKPARSWIGKTDYEKIKLHKYKQQLMFYKLLVENARDYRGHKVESGILQFVEPSKSGDIISLTAEFDTTEQEQFVLLINAVWRHIINLDLPDISSYDKTLKGILAFEQDLIDNIA
ncbi:ATP-dependent helicase, partial [Candidatus Saccharibacteria bacterium]|nr:ATP-dependent helicase [Candidatus Saccharibacteria bacterium]